MEWKKWLNVVLAIALAVLAVQTASASDTKSGVGNGEVEVYFNGEKIDFDQPPIIVNGRTKVPFRAIFETLGTVVFYRESDHGILGLSRDGDTISHTVGTDTAILNKTEKIYDSASEIINDRTLVPVRMVADLLGAQVEWNEKQQTVTIHKEIYTNEYHKKIRGILGCVPDINFNPMDFTRYLDYQYNHWDMDPKQVILDVNMDLDRELVEREFEHPNPQSVEEITIFGLFPKESEAQLAHDTDSNIMLVNKFNVLPFDHMPDNMYNPTLINEGNREYTFYGGDFSKYTKLKEATYQDFINMDSAFKEHMNRSFGFTLKSAFKTPMELLKDYQKYQNGYMGHFHPEFSSSEKLEFTFGTAYEDLQTGLSFLIGGRWSSNRTYQAVKEGLLLPTDMAEWLQGNSFHYGFVQRYPAGKEYITRVFPNLQVWRYVGRDVAQVMHDENLCLEEYCAKYTNPSGYRTDLESTQTRVLDRY